MDEIILNPFYTKVNGIYFSFFLFKTILLRVKFALDLPEVSLFLHIQVEGFFCY